MAVKIIFKDKDAAFFVYKRMIDMARTQKRQFSGRLDNKIIILADAGDLPSITRSADRIGAKYSVEDEN